METKGFLSAADILRAEDLDYKNVHVPEWGGMVRLRALSAADSLVFLSALEGDGRKYANARLVAMSIVDENGNRLFTGDSLAALEGKNVRIINQLSEEALILNGMKAKVETKAEETKNA